MERCSFELPDFSAFEALLLEKAGPIRFIPGNTTVDGSRLELIPCNNLGKFAGRRVNSASYPRLELAKAGIEIDRRLETVQAAATEFLKGYQFSFQTELSLIVTVCIARKAAQLFSLQAFAMEMKYRMSLRAPSDQRLEEELWAPIALLPAAELLISADREVPGLDLSKPVVGSYMDLAAFLVSGDSMSEGELQTYHLAALLCDTSQDGSNAFGELDEYLGKHGDSFLRNLFSFKLRRLKKECVQCAELFRRLKLGYETAFAALEEGKDVSLALTQMVSEQKAA